MQKITVFYNGKAEKQNKGKYLAFNTCYYNNPNIFSFAFYKICKFWYLD